MSEAPEFTVIMPVCHGGAFLREALKAARELDVPPGELEVLVAGSADDEEARGAVEAAAAQAPFRLRYVACPRANRSAMLNAAWAEARGRILAFTDDDCRPPPHWPAELRAALERRPGVGVVGGRDEQAAEADSFDLALDWVLNAVLRRAPGGKRYPRLWNMAVTAEAARAAGFREDGAPPKLFDESLAVHEDVELCERIEASGRAVAFAPRACVAHARDTTLRATLGRNFQMARACRRLGVHRLPHLVLAGSLLAGAALAGLAAFVPPAQVALVAGAAAYAAVVLGCAVAAAVSARRLGALPHAAALLVGLHVARGLGYLLPGSRPGGAAREGAGGWAG